MTYYKVLRKTYYYKVLRNSNREPDGPYWHSCATECSELVVTYELGEWARPKIDSYLMIFPTEESALYFINRYLSHRAFMLGVFECEAEDVVEIPRVLEFTSDYELLAGFWAARDANGDWSTFKDSWYLKASPPLTLGAKAVKIIEQVY